MTRVTSMESGWLRSLWLALLITASALLTTVYTCVTPFAAFAVLAAISLSRGHAVLLTLAVWTVNQAVGFGALNYPWTGTTAAWGLAIGGAAVIGTLAAHWIAGRFPSPRAAVQALAAFVVAFAFYELSLYTVAASMLGGTGAFATPIIARVLLINAVTLVGLYGVTQIMVLAAGVLGSRRAASASQRQIA